MISLGIDFQAGASLITSTLGTMRTYAFSAPAGDADPETGIGSSGPPVEVQAFTRRLKATREHVERHGMVLGVDLLHLEAAPFLAASQPLRQGMTIGTADGPALLGRTVSAKVAGVTSYYLATITGTEATS